MITELIHQEDITFVSAYIPNNRLLKYAEHNKNEKINRLIIIFEDSSFSQ